MSFENVDALKEKGKRRCDVTLALLKNLNIINNMN